MPQQVDNLFKMQLLISVTIAVLIQGLQNVKTWLVICGQEGRFRLLAVLHYQSSQVYIDNQNFEFRLSTVLGG